jgi:hypothetical protein
VTSQRRPTLGFHAEVGPMREPRSGGAEQLRWVGTSGDDSAGREQAGDSIWSTNGDFLELTDESRQ